MRLNLFKGVNAVKSDAEMDKKRAALASAMRRVFETADGQLLLDYLLSDLCFFDITQNAKQEALRDYAAKFLNDLYWIGGLRISYELTGKETPVSAKT